jgi:SSS family solute:Na+ symporter
MAALVIAAGLAALMSTMDSQLLTLSSIFTRDILSLSPKFKGETSLSGRVFVIFLSIAGLLLAYKPPATILQIATQTFTGLAVLFPTVIFGLYLKKVFPLAALLSIVCGEGAMLLFYFKLLSAGPFLPVVWVMVVTFGVYLATHAALLGRSGKFALQRPGWIGNRYVYLFGAIFILAMDYWAWNKAQPLLAGIPAWIGFFVLLSAGQTVGMVYMVRKK